MWAFDLHIHYECDPTVVIVMKVTAIAGWILLLMVVVGLLVVFDPLGGKRSSLRAGNLDEAETASAAKRLWELR